MLINQMPATVAGILYQHIGRTFFVAPSASYTIGSRTYTASDGNDGLSPDKALLTVAQALTLTTANAGDVVVLLPGAHTASASLAMSKAGVTLTGLPRGMQGGVNQQTSLTTSATADQIINVTAANIEIAHLSIIPITAAAAIDFTAAGDQLYIHDCYFDLETPAVNVATIGVDAVGAASNLVIRDCVFVSDGAQGAAIDLTGTINAIVERCKLIGTAGTWAAAITTGAATTGAIISQCMCYSHGTAITAGVDGTGATIAAGVHVEYCTFGNLVTVSVDNFDAGEATLVEVYKAGVGATDGGTKVTAIT